MSFATKLGLTIATGAGGALAGGAIASTLDPDVVAAAGDLWPDFLAPATSSAKDQGVAVIGGGVMLTILLISSGLIWRNRQ
jgi:hypothetical protein